MSSYTQNQVYDSRSSLMLFANLIIHYLPPSECAKESRAIKFSTSYTYKGEKFFYEIASCRASMICFWGVIKKWRQRFLYTFFYVFTAAITSRRKEKKWNCARPLSLSCKSVMQINKLLFFFLWNLVWGRGNGLRDEDCDHPGEIAKKINLKDSSKGANFINISKNNF